jgi:hypothetical protein
MKFAISTCKTTRAFFTLLFVTVTSEKKRMILNSLSLSLFYAYTKEKKRSLSLFLSLAFGARTNHTTRFERTHHSFFLVSENNTGRLMMTFVCVCVQLVFDFEETKGTKDYCLGFSVENSKMFKNRLCRRFFHTSSSSSERCLVTHARTTHAYHPYSRR